MKNENKDYSTIPASACLLVSGKFELGDNGEGSKTAPISMLARTGQPIEHWWWGRVVHDLSGMQLHKSRLPIDYVHDPNQILGYLNKFESGSGDLVVSGALTPHTDSDRASEVIYKSRAGVPYEASIDFSGEGIKLQEVPEGMVTEVNGFQFEGPGVVIRQWPLRGVAVCPYGADMNTESTVLGDNKNRVFAASIIEPEATTEGGSEMSESVEVPASETTEADEPKTELTAVEAEAAEEVATEEPASEGVESDEAVETEEPAEATDETTGEVSRDEFCRIVDKFGAEIAAQTVKDGGSYESALELAYEQASAKIEALEAQLSQKQKSTGGKPASAGEEFRERKPLIRIQGNKR
jgi:hypothetical protein